MKNVLVLSVFNGFDPAYSLCGVVTDQAAMLRDKGYPTRVILVKGQDPSSDAYSKIRHLAPGVELVPDLPDIVCQDWQVGSPVDRLEEDAERITRALDSHVAWADVVITHDILLQTFFLKHNLAMRRLAINYPNVKWLNWAHSAPSTRPTKLEFPHALRFDGDIPNSRIVYPNWMDKPRVAAYFGVRESKVAVVPHSRDLLDYLNASDRVRALEKKHGICDANIIMAYPARFVEGKQPKTLIKLAAALNLLGTRSVVIFIASYAKGSPESEKLITECKVLAREHGIERDIIFTNEFCNEWSLFVPEDEVRTLQMISDVFVLPSLSETYSLVAAEAALARNLLVLNADFPPIYDIYGHDALYSSFSSCLATTVHTDQNGEGSASAEMEYLTGQAARIITELSENKQAAMFIKMRGHFSRRAIMRDYMEPLVLS